MRDWLTNKAWLPTGQASSLILNYTHDAHGDVTRIHSGNVNGVDTSYSYDALNRLATATDTHTGTTTYGYDAVGNLAGYAYPNGVTNGYTYDLLNRLTNLVSDHAGDLRAGYAYTVLPSGHRRTASENVATTNGVQTINRLFSYDTTYRLTDESLSVSGPVSLPASANVGYTLDDVGIRFFPPQIPAVTSIVSTLDFA